MSNELALRETRNIVVNEILGHLAHADSQVVSAMNKAAEIDSIEVGKEMLLLTDEQLAEKGWTRKELRIAVDAKHSKKEAPYYLDAANTRVCLRWKGNADNAPSGQGAITVIIPVFNNTQDHSARIIDAEILK